MRVCKVYVGELLRKENNPEDGRTICCVSALDFSQFFSSEQRLNAAFALES